MKLILPLLLLVSSSVFAQITETEVKNMISKSTEQDLVGHSSRFLQENFYHFADLTVDKLLTFDKNNGNYNYRKGFILLGMNKSPEMALTHLQIASKNVEINYDIYSPTEKSAPIDVYYYLGVCKHRLGDFTKANEYFQQFINESNKNSVLIPLAQIRMTQLANAKKIIANPTGSLPQLLSTDVNTDKDEINALISSDAKSLIYSSSRQRQDNMSDNSKEPMYNTFPFDAYQITKDKKGSWGASTLFLMNDAKVDERLGSVSHDERNVAFSNWETPNLYTNTFNGGSFEKAKGVTVALETGKSDIKPWNSHLCISMDGKYAFFISNAITGKGGLDIYMMESVNGTWSAPKNMAMINTESNELAPYLSMDGKTLYFSSDSKESMGGLDIFKSTQDENGMWTKPVNMGYPLNSTSDEVSFSLSGDGTLAYVSSNRIGGVGMYDIYGADVQETPSNIAMLNGRIVNTKGKQIPEQSYITIKCMDCANTSEFVLTPRMRDGVFMTNLEKCKEYELAYYYGPTTRNPYKSKFNTKCDNAFEIVHKKVMILDDEQKIIPFPTYEIKGIVTDITTGNPIANAAIQVAIDDKNKTENTLESGLYSSNIIESYEFESSVKGSLKAEAEGYLAVVSSVEQELLEDSVITVNFQLEGTARGIIGPYFVNYQFNKFMLTDYSKNKLKEVIKVMNDNPTLKIEMRSHTDSRGSAIYNQWLSDMRAKTAKEYIQAKIVNPERITSQGFGESELLVPCGDGVECSEAEHIKNRRTEFLILK